MVWPHPLDVIQYARSSYYYNNVYVSFTILPGYLVYICNCGKNTSIWFRRYLKNSTIRFNILFNSCDLEIEVNGIKSLTLCLLVSSATFANTLDPDQAQQNVEPGLDPNCSTLMVFLKEFFEKVDFENMSRRQKSMQNYPVDKVKS